MKEASWLLAMDIGNTQVVIGIMEGDRVRTLLRLTSQMARTADEIVPLLETHLRPYTDHLLRSKRAVLASVVPSLTGAYEAYATRLMGKRPVVVSAELPLGVRLSVPDPASVGADRIANAVAVAAMHRLPAIVVDLGTATTFDVVLPGPRYVGGVIAPGILTSAEELFRRGARLPKVELRVPARTIGRTTEESIQSGVFFGAVGQIEGILRRIAKDLPSKPTIVATGGLAPALAPVCRSLRNVDEGLTIQGLRIIDEKVRARRRRKSA